MKSLAGFLMGVGIGLVVIGLWPISILIAVGAILMTVATVIDAYLLIKKGDLK